MWARLKAEREAARENVVDDSEFEVVVTQEAREFDEPCGPLASYVKLAHANGWTLVKLAHALSFAKGKPFKSGANEGAIRPDQNIETQWLFGEKPGVGRFVVAYTIVNDKVRGTSTYRRMNGIVRSDSELKAMIKQ